MVQIDPVAQRAGMMWSVGRKACLVALLCAAGVASAQVRIATWNISNYNGTDRAAEIGTVLYGQVPTGLALAGQRMNPDLLMVQEVSNSTVAATLRNVLNAAAGSPGDWLLAPFTTGPDTQGVLLYRSSKFTFVNSVVISQGGLTPAPPRNTVRYDLRPFGYSDASTTLSFYVVHMKAPEGGTDDEARRGAEAQRIRENASGLDTNPNNGVADGLPAGRDFMVAGDLNIPNPTLAAETAYRTLVNPPALGQFFDPINSFGNWNNNNAFRFIQTQDPAGQMDDRFDQILVSASLRDAAGWHYIGSNTLAYSTSTWNDPNHSYRAWGNDGTSFDIALRTTGNLMVGPAIAQAIITCAAGLGHVPVFADFRVPARAAVTGFTNSPNIIDFGTVAQGAPPPARTLTVTNTGDTARFGANGIARLNYTLPPGADFSYIAGPFFANAGVPGTNHVLTMPTNTPGIRNTTITITTDAPDQPSFTVILRGVVTASGPTCDSLDFNQDGDFPTPLDLEDFINAVGGNICATCSTDLDFNNDGDFPTPLDIEAFISVSAGGPCL